jgi:hypothetical protein
MHLLARRKPAWLSLLSVGFLDLWTGGCNLPLIGIL